jgi:MYXO-CTERM domain-containing protein
VFHRNNRLNWLLCVVFILVSGCGGLGGGCGGCSTQPLPAGGLPKDQTIEGGGQVRVTQAGFTKLTSILPALISQQLGAGICLPGGSIGSPSFTGANYCGNNQGGACGGGSGCNVSLGIHPGSFSVGVTGAQKLNLKLGLDVHAIVPLDGHIVFVPASCNMHVDGDNITIDVDLSLGINATTGELEIHLDNINSFDSSSLNLSNCGLLSDLGNLVNGLLNSFIGQLVIPLLKGTIDNLVQGFLPHPLGIEGLVDVGSLLAGVSPGTEAEMELRMVPGGYVDLSHNNGLSLGLITGVNSDWDTSTRTPDLDSEPALCVPPIPAPDFGAAPHSLPKSPRSNFQLAPAGEFLGVPADPASDLAIGLSETTLDQFGHHAVTSGAMCLGVGTTFVPQLNLGTIGLLVPSLADLGTDSGTDPILLVTRPQKALDFKIGEGTDTSPALTISIQDMEVDFYAFIYQRYERAFTLSLTLDVGVNLEFQQLPGMPATVTPQLVGLTAANIHLKVSNSEFVHESPAELEQVLPTVFDLALPLLGNALKPINVPSFAGFTLNDLRVQHVTTQQDDFLAIYASLGASQMMRTIGQHNQMMADTVRGLDKAIINPGDVPVTGTSATIRTVDVPKPDIVRNALLGKRDGKLPSVTIDVAQRDDQGRELEYSWNLNGGVWRPFTQASPLVISDRAFAWQGKYMIGVRSRVKGDYHTTDAVGVTLPVIIDSVAPRIFVDDVREEDGKIWAPATDIVTGSADLLWAFGRVGDKQPATSWQHSAGLQEAAIANLAGDGEFMVWVKDEAGNTALARVPLPFHGAPGTGGCACSTSDTGPSSGGVVLFLMVGVALFGRRRARTVVTAIGRRGGRALPAFFVWAGITVVTSLVPGCSCGGKPGVQACETTMDCAAQCPAGTVPLCFDHECACVDDIPYGRIGPYSDVDVSPTGADVYVSAYAQSHGDLVVAKHTGDGRIPNEEWEFVDGVPDGPVVVPGSTIRGGIGEPGPNVGMYTSIAVNADSVPMVTYQDVDTGSLKFAAKFGGTWTNHVIDAGTGSIDAELGGEITGLYTSLTKRADDGRPGVAYMAEVSDGGGIVRAEVRYAAAQVPNPVSPSDWTTWVVDTITLPPIDPAKPDPYPLPEGLGLFLDSARNPMNQAPVVVYYDRVNGDLKMAEFDAVAGTFKAPVVVDGAGANNDVGWYPSVTVDAEGTIHMAYQSATRDDLLYTNTKTNTPELIDDGYRIVGQTPEGYPKPEFHFIGNDVSLQVTTAGPVVSYQDSTSHELLMSARKNSGEWMMSKIAGGAMPTFTGAYGFFTSSVISSSDLVISNWVIDQPNYDQWVEIHRMAIAPQ